MDGWLIALAFLAILTMAFTITEIFEIKARAKENDCSKTQELDDLKKRVEALEQTLASKEG